MTKFNPKFIFWTCVSKENVQIVNWLSRKVLDHISQDHIQKKLLPTSIPNNSHFFRYNSDLFWHFAYFESRCSRLFAFIIISLILKRSINIKVIRIVWNENCICDKVDIIKVHSANWITLKAFHIRLLASLAKKIFNPDMFGLYILDI